MEDVLNVFCKLRQTIPAKLLLIGDGPERLKMEELSRQICAPDDVRFLGKLDQVEEVLSVSDLFLMTSEKESFGLAALEAMACEVPVISSDAGGLPELVQDGKSGFVCKVGDVNEMVKKAIHILDEDNLSNFKKGALARAKEFDLDVILPLYENYYMRIQEKSLKSVG